MPELTREEKLKIFSQLSPQLQEVLFSDATADTVDRIGKKYGLDDDRVSLLAGIIGDVILKIVPITSLAQEINSKIISDTQAAMSMAQELNTELLAPAMTAPAITPPISSGQVPSSKFQVPSADKYREPTAGPEVVDLRNRPKAGPPLAETPPSPAEAGYGGQRPSVDREGGPSPELPVAPKSISPTPAPTPAPVPVPAPAPAPTPKPIPLTPPLTFIRPIEPVAPAQPTKPIAPTMPAPTTPLIEAEPHKISIPVRKPIIPPVPQNLEPRPQYIIRPSGAPPTDRPENILDLKQDRGEF